MSQNPKPINSLQMSVFDDTGDSSNVNTERDIQPQNQRPASRPVCALLSWMVDSELLQRAIADIVALAPIEVRDGYYGYQMTDACRLSIDNLVQQDALLNSALELLGRRAPDWKSRQRVPRAIRIGTNYRIRAAEGFLAIAIHLGNRPTDVKLSYKDEDGDKDVILKWDSTKVLFFTESSLAPISGEIRVLIMVFLIERG
ncbi:hypothetical protein BGZ63DRAFT_222092 [Mariannaea sp. PMI_226]|nr:hypothetical protein BGZ63DRAFT_222092 [Mariannaea sp. PMI_226]